MPAQMGDTRKYRKKYLVQPGRVISSFDGQSHFISASVLIKLYKVSPNECVIERNDFMPMPGRVMLGLEDLIVLKPRADGEYLTKDGTPNVG
jgi:hypothetical protein